MALVKKNRQGPEGLSDLQYGETVETHAITHDAVFGTITEEGPNYRNVGLWGTAALMMKTQIGLGVLSMPVVFNTFGIIPGVVVLLAVAGVNTWADWMVGVFKLRHRHVYCIDDVGQMLFGGIGSEVLGGAYCLYYTFAAGSAMLSLSIALNAVSSHAVCTAVFMGVAAIVTIILSSIRTLAHVSWVAWLGSICIIIAVFFVTIAVSQQDRPSAAPQEGPWQSDYQLVAKPTFVQAISGVSTLVFTYAGTPAFFSIVAEMKDPHLFTRALVVCQTTVTVVYLIVGVIISYYCGSYVASPALGSAGPLFKKIGYGIAIPGLLASSTLLLHYPAKYVFVRVLRGSKHLTDNSAVHWISWIGSTSTVGTVSYLIASGIPIFGPLVSLIGAILGTSLSFQPMGAMWLYDNWKREDHGLGWRFGVFWSWLVIVMGTFLTVAGTYGSIVGIIEALNADAATRPWGCGDNSNST